MQQKQPSRQNKKDENQELAKIVALLLDHWKLFVFSLLIFITGGILYARYSAPGYVVRATLLVEDQEKGGNIFGSASSMLQDFSSLLDVKSNVDNEAQILQTRDIIEKVVRDLDLNIVYYKKGLIHSVELYHNCPFGISILTPPERVGTGLFSFSADSGSDNFLLTEKSRNSETTYRIKWGDTVHTRIAAFVIQRTGQPFYDKNNDYIFSINSIDGATEALKQKISVTIPNKEVSTIDLLIKYPVPGKGEDILTKMIDEYIIDNLGQKNAYADSTISFIDNRLLVVNDELAGIEKGVQTFKRTNQIADIDEQSKDIIDNSADYLKQLNEVEVHLQVVQTMLKYVQDENNIQRPVPSLMMAPDPTFLALLDKYNTLQIQRDRLGLGNTDKNPVIINLGEQIDNLRKDLITNLRNQETALTITRQNLQNQNNTITSYIQGAPQKERQLLDLSREQDIKQALFIYLLQKKEEVAITKSSNIPSSRMIDHPKADTLPYTPKKPLIYAGALLLGLLLPYGFLTLRAMLNRKISSRDEINELTDLTVIGEINHSDQQQVFKENARSIIAEQFRGLRTNLQFVLGAQESPVILLTSSMSGEGKSFIATNLANTYAASGKKVLLIELDLRKPGLSKYLGISSAEGISNYLSTTISVDKILLHNHESVAGLNTDVDVIFSGQIPPNPSELLSHPRMKILIDTLRPRYDIILLDTPPVGVVADAQILAPLANSVLYIVRQDYTYKQQLNIPNDLKESGKMSNIYLVVNDVEMKTSYRYGYGSKYGYGYGYGYGYSSNGIEKKTPRKRKAGFFQSKK